MLQIKTTFSKIFSYLKNSSFKKFTFNPPHHLLNNVKNHICGIQIILNGICIL